MLGLGGPAWGPLTSVGAILGSTPNFDAMFDQIREKSTPFWDPFWDNFEYVDVFVYLLYDI